MKHMRIFTLIMIIIMTSLSWAGDLISFKPWPMPKSEATLTSMSPVPVWASPTPTQVEKSLLYDFSTNKAGFVFQTTLATLHDFLRVGLNVDAVAYTGAEVSQDPMKAGIGLLGHYQAAKELRLNFGPALSANQNAPIRLGLIVGITLDLPTP